MLVAYIIQKTLEPHIITQENHALLKKALWIDLLNPTKEEEDFVEHYLNLGIPTREEMVEIEQSSRLYKENGVLFMTAIMIAQHESSEPVLDPVSFIVTSRQLITIRYIEPKSFKILQVKLQKLDTRSYDALTLLLDLYDVTIDRLADTLELVGHRLDEYSRSIFRPQNNNTEKLDYRQLMQQIGANGDLNTKARESLVTFNRLIVFFGHIEVTLDNEKRGRLATLGKDIDSLSDHANFLSTKVNFLLDATLGLVNIEQNNIIKIFSVAAVIFLPPTLVASIYGMNFHFMPELRWKFGYLFAVSLILLAAYLPYKFFKHKKWL